MKAKLRNPEDNIVVKPDIYKINRKERRKIAKTYHLSISQVNQYMMNSFNVELETLVEGVKVKLNYDRIMENKSDKSQKYLEFVEQHKDEVMTIVYDENHKVNPTVFCLEEDTNPNKWLFDISELILAEDFTIGDINSELDNTSDNI